MGKKDLSIIELTKAQAEKFSAEQIQSDLVPRLSNRRCHAFLVSKVETGAINIPAQAIMALTYKAVSVTGVDVKCAGKKKPVVTMSKAEFGKQGPGGVAKLLREHTTEKRAMYAVTALLTEGKLSLSPRDMVYLSNGRVSVAGITIESARQGTDMGALIAGVTIAKPAVADEDAA